MSELLRETLRSLRRAGYSPVVTYSRHIKIKFIDRHNCTRLIVVSRSPSSRFARRQNRALVRRILRSSST
jgi:hypothetical protein